MSKPIYRFFVQRGRRSVLVKLNISPSGRTLSKRFCGDGAMGRAREWIKSESQTILAHDEIAGRKPSIIFVNDGENDG